MTKRGDRNKKELCSDDRVRDGFLPNSERGGEKEN